MASRKIIKFSKYFSAAVVLSAVLIVAGIVSVIVRGVNFGLDFKPGLIEEIKIADNVLDVSYGGSATVKLEVNSDDVQVVVSGIGADNKTVVIPYAEVSDVSSLASRLSAVEGVTASVVRNVPLSENALFVSSVVSSSLGTTPLKVFTQGNAGDVSADEVRNALRTFDDVDVKAVGTDADRSFQVRMGASGETGGKALQSATTDALYNAFGADKVVVVKSDFIGAQFSRSLISGSVVLVLATLVLIFIYATIRFKWDFALASVIAIIHDALIMISFISWSQMEFSTTTLAAILTIIGYSINATVVILDRVRSDIRVVEADSFVDVLNSALSATLGRSVITTVTTLFAVLALFFFTTGTIHDFALSLTVGLISGCYSSIFIAGAFISFTRRNFRFAKPAKMPVDISHVAKFEPQS